MRPLCGVVVGIKRSTLVIKLESGITITRQKATGYGIGTRCWVSYDFTENKFGKLHKYNPLMEIEEDTTEEPEMEEEGGENDDIDEEFNDSSGALSPDSDEWGFWNSVL